MEQLDYDLLFHGFVSLFVDDPVWDRSVFGLSRDCLLDAEVGREFFNRVLNLAEWQGFVSDEHFSVGGTLIEAWVSHKSFVRKDGGGPDRPPRAQPRGRLQGEARSNATHENTTDPGARLYKKGGFTEAKLRYMGHALTENRHGLVVDVETTQANSTAEWDAAERMIRRSAVDGRTARGKDYALSLRRRKMIEEAWLDQGRRRLEKEPAHRPGQARGAGAVHLRHLQPDAAFEPDAAEGQADAGEIRVGTHPSAAGRAAEMPARIPRIERQDRPSDRPAVAPGVGKFDQRGKSKGS